MALASFAATVFALFVGATRRGEELGAIGLQVAGTLAMLGVLWVLIGIMFTLARSYHLERDQVPRPTPADS